VLAVTNDTVFPMILSLSRVTRTSV